MWSSDSAERTAIVVVCSPVVNLLSNWPAAAQMQGAIRRRQTSAESKADGEMTTEKRSWVRLDGLSDRQLAILREDANDWLVTKADDLPKGIDDADGAKRETEEVAALGRLASGLRRGEVLVPDPIARELIARTIAEARHLDELKEEYDRELGEHESWVALLAHFDTAPDADAAEAGDEEDRGAEPESLDEDGPGAPASDRIELDGRLSDDQLRAVLKEVTGTLAGRTGDLRLLHKTAEPEREVSEIAALARLAFWLVRGEIQVPDRVAQEMVVRLAESSDELNEWEELRERHEDGVAEHEALLAFAGIFSDASPSRSGEGEDD
jgi:hypothetical protein